jgi:hypothetical protein
LIQKFEEIDPAQRESPPRRIVEQHGKAVGSVSHDKIGLAVAIQVDHD